jgi:type VI protein secretion system component Hcp
MKARLPTLCAAALLLAAPSARAVGFALLQATDIPGESADPAFTGWIELTSLGLSGPLNTGLPGMFLVHKRIDKASPLLAKRCATGQHIKEAKLVLRETAPAPGSPPLICVVTMSDLLVASFSTALDEAAGQPLETVALKFSRIYFHYFARDGSETTASLSLGQSTTDTDADGMPDAWENYYGLAPDHNNANDDDDGDGLTDLQEFQLGTNPVSDDSRFSALVTPVPEDPGSIDLSWDAVPGVAYVIEWSPDLVERFAPLGGDRLADSSLMKVRITKSGPTGFFRVRPAGS